MTRECMDCQKHMGEKCPKCGKDNVCYHLSIDDETNAVIKVFTCLNTLCPAVDGARRYQFNEGEGGITSGICADCLTTRYETERKTSHA